MKKYEAETGLLGTVIIHLIAAIIFMSFQLSSLQTIRSGEFEVEYIPEKVAEAGIKSSGTEKVTVESILRVTRKCLI